MEARVTRQFKALLLVGLLAVPGATRAAEGEDKPTLTPYGFIRLDAIWSDSRMQNPHTGMWVESEPPGLGNDPELSIHPRLSRLGLKVEPYSLSPNVKANAVVEIDFQNGGTESRQALRMRHAYVQFTAHSLELLLGQTWDLVSPLYPSVNSDGLMWNAGNTGDRRPQLRLTFRPGGETSGVRLAASAGMPDAVNNQDFDGNGQLDGLDAAVPAFQALAEIGTRHLLVGVWGHVEQERIRQFFGNTRNFTGELVGGHLRISPGSRFAFQGEGFWGQDATDVRAGIGQGIRFGFPEFKVVRTVGGWAEGDWKACSKYDLAVGASIDQPHRSDLRIGDRRQNTSVYLAQHLKPWAQTTIGLDYVRWNTLYVDRPAGRANRFNGYLAYNF
jgi:hypothetical protein